MDLSHFVGIAAVISFLVVSPGPSGLLIVRTVPSAGRACGFASIGGFLAAFCMHGAMLALGVSVLLAKSAVLLAAVKYLGAAYLCWIGFKALLAATQQPADSAQAISSTTNKSLRNCFSEGFFTNALNPKILIFYLAVFPHFLPPGDSAVSMALLLVGLHSAFSAIWFGGLVLLLANLRTARLNMPLQRCLNGAAGTAFIGIGVKYSTLVV